MFSYLVVLFLLVLFIGYGYSLEMNDEDNKKE